MSSGRVEKYPGHIRVSLLFSASQKYAWVGSGRVRAHLAETIDFFSFVFSFLNLCSLNYNNMVQSEDWNFRVKFQSKQQKSLSKKNSR